MPAGIEAPVVRPLVDHPELVPVLAQWLRSAWPDYYRDTGPMQLAREVAGCARRDALPLALVAFEGPEPAGTVTLRREGPRSLPHGGPWVGALYVTPPARGRGIATRLVEAAVARAVALGFARVRMAVHGRHEHYLARDWCLLERARTGGERVWVLERSLAP